MHLPVSLWLIALALDLIKKLLVVDPKARFTTEEALEHPWLQVGLGDASEHEIHGQLPTASER